MTSVEIFVIVLGLVFGYLVVSHFTGPKVPPEADAPAASGEPHGQDSGGKGM